MIPKLCLDNERHGYVLLGTIQVDKKMAKKTILTSPNRIDLVNKFYINQVK